ncbi:MAG: chemotaxis protein CheB [Planctomycetes bacterium]|nr:chemotaxis protein CheB [Planctomycetota bacterium]
MRPKAIIAIASSTGGPQILRKIVNGLPVLDAAFIIVQHMQASACRHFALNLNKITEMEVKIAENGDSLQSGTVYIAPTGLHLAVNGLSIALFKGRKINFVCPAADFTMQSMQNCSVSKKVGIVLSGLGEDGAKGIEHMKKCGATTIVQDPDTCVVSCMSYATLDTGCVDYVLEPDQIRNAIIKLAGYQKCPA